MFTVIGLIVFVQASHMRDWRQTERRTDRHSHRLESLPNWWGAGMTIVDSLIMTDETTGDYICWSRGRSWPITAFTASIACPLNSHQPRPSGLAWMSWQPDFMSWTRRCTVQLNLRPNNLRSRDLIVWKRVQLVCGSHRHSRSIFATLSKVSPTSRLLWNTSPPGCLQIFLLLTLPRLNFWSLVLNSNFLK